MSYSSAGKDFKTKIEKQISNKQDLEKLEEWSEKVLVVKSIKATENDLKKFHSSSYIDILKKTNVTDDIEALEKELAQHGLNYDCPVLERNFDFVCRIAGGTLTAAMLLCRKISRIAINWSGGWHHAQRDEAEGFCYVNDIVLGIQKLQKVFDKILYVDLDVHHGTVYSSFEPSAIVVQCGADILFGDRVGQCNVTIKALVKCVKKIINCNIPCLVLGGGGYNFANTARYWTCITSTIIDTEIDDDIPDCSEYFTLYTPTYELRINPGNQKDYNTEEYIANVIDTIHKYCDFITKNNIIQK
ncbi:histone deacetylase [Holotrichia oblita]|uniref:Histone deacetylase n=1 Tax=Holotrichia oblita TaxID=644536 RepID=A0ACB9TA79_HOLOL|nr:histone deacetylase [Holotrichia oblita]